ncbi:hypothetical protein [Actinomadura madurae]|uniref:hypothetical protein n=1 Tax=Actinomadura madurae TaxID=1993 RepID=UPI0020D1F64C|nr:hypothetical protein [Actinomadura madurae]MCP9952421.1 hypothetical protein [Actinomadura madurae]MCP9981658.1 hypothetical protein [Actinomadura madurae]
MDTHTATATAATSDPATLRKLYFLRFAFAAIWAALLFTTADTLGPVSVALLLIYPLFDVASAVADARSTRARGGRASALYANIAVSSLTVAGLAAAAASGVPAVLRVWGPGPSPRGSSSSSRAPSAGAWAGSGR